jgi:uncharacterized membrane protein YbhN (UPF0104 family)
MPSSRNGPKYIVSGVFLIVLGYFAFKFREELAVIREVSPLQILGMFCLAFLTVAVNGSKLNQIARGFNIRLQKKEWFGLSSITATLNNIFFKAGSLVTSNYLKRKYDLPYTSFIGSLGADQLILLFMNSLVGGGISFYLVTQNEKGLYFVGTAYLLAAVFLFFLMQGKLAIKNQGHYFWDALARVLQALDQILKNRRLFIILCLHYLGLLILLSFRFYVVCHILKLDVPLPHCFLFTTMVIFVSSVPLIQSDVGARELAVGFLAELAGLGFNQGLLATIVDRVIVLFCTALMAGIFRNILLSPRSAEQQA